MHEMSKKRSRESVSGKLSTSTLTKVENIPEAAKKRSKGHREMTTEKNLELKMPTMLKNVKLEWDKLDVEASSTSINCSSLAQKPSASKTDGLHLNDLFLRQLNSFSGAFVRKDDALDSMLRQKSNRTAVYSGRSKPKKSNEVSKLRDLCTQFIAAHVDGVFVLLCD